MPKLIVAGGDFKANTSGFFNSRFLSLPLAGARKVAESVKMDNIVFLELASTELGKYFQLEDNIAELKLMTPKDKVLCLAQLEDKRHLIAEMDKEHFFALKSLFVRRQQRLAEA